MSITIRAAAISDAAAIARLSEQLGYPASESTVGARIAATAQRADYLTIVAQTEQLEICGWLQAHSVVTLESGNLALIMGLVVDEQRRRTGVGRKLVASAEAWATARSADAIVVRSNVRRTESHAFYPALGYLQTKTQAAYRKSLGPMGQN